MPRFFHVSTSATLVGLTKSEFNLCSSKDLIEKYNFAPIAGEISAGGSRGATINPGIAFAKEGDSYWTLNNLLKLYGQYGFKKTFTNAVEVKDAVVSTINLNFSYISEIIVKLMREQEMGEVTHLSLELIKELCGKIDDHLNKIIRFYLRNYIVAASLQYTFDQPFNAPEIRYSFLEYMASIIPLNFFELTTQQKEDFYASFPEIFEKAMQANPGFTGWLPFSTYFQRVHPISGQDFYEYAFSTAIIYPDREDFIQYHLSKYNDLKSTDLIKLEDEIKKNCNALTKQVELLKNLLHGYGATELATDEKDYCANSFPIVFIFEDETKLKKIRYEYRANCNLKLGVDIKTLATNETNIPKLKFFLAMNNLENIEVISIERDLQLMNVPEVKAATLGLFGRQQWQQNDQCFKQTQSSVGDSSTDLPHL